jgi:hypothetical protein
MKTEDYRTAKNRTLNKCDSEKAEGYCSTTILFTNSLENASLYHGLNSVPLHLGQGGRVSVSSSRTTTWPHALHV